MKNKISECSGTTYVGTEDFEVSAMEQEPGAAVHQRPSSALIELPTPDYCEYNLSARITAITLEPDLNFFSTPQKNSPHIANDSCESQDKIPAYDTADPSPSSLSIPDGDKRDVSGVEKPRSSKRAGPNSIEGIDRLGCCDRVPDPSSPEDLSMFGLGSGAFAASNLGELHSPQGSGRDDRKIGAEDFRDIWRELESIQSRLMQLDVYPKSISEREPDHATCRNSEDNIENSPRQDSVPRDDKNSDSTKNKQSPISFKNDEGSGGDDEENQERKRKRPNLSPDCQTKRKFACLYHKFNPAVYGMRGDRKYLICEATGFTFISELL